MGGTCQGFLRGGKKADKSFRCTVFEQHIFLISSQNTLKVSLKPPIVAEDCNSSPPEAEAGGLVVVFSQPGLHSELLGQPDLQHEKEASFQLTLSFPPSQLT